MNILRWYRGDDWKNGGVADRVWDTLDELETAVVERCRLMRETMRDDVRRLTRCHW